MVLGFFFLMIRLISVLWGKKSYIKAIINQKIKIAFQTYVASNTKGAFNRTGELPAISEFRIGSNIFPYVASGI